MHEFSVASGILETVIDEAKKHNAEKVTRISLELGKLSMISGQQLEFALQILSEGTMAEGAKIHIRVRPLIIKCARGHVSEVSGEGYDLYARLRGISCSDCGGEVDLIGGKECMIKEIAAE